MTFHGNPPLCKAVVCSLVRQEHHPPCLVKQGSFHTAKDVFSDQLTETCFCGYYGIQGRMSGLVSVESSRLQMEEG